MALPARDPGDVHGRDHAACAINDIRSLSVNCELESRLVRVLVAQGRQQSLGASLDLT